MSDQIRSIMLRQAKEHPESAFHVSSNLNWLRYKLQIDYLAKFLLQGSKVLELGCGWGQTAAMLAMARPDIEIIGTDINPSSSWIELAKFGCSFQCCDATHLPFDSNNFDAIISFGVIEHTINDVSFLRENHRCLKNGGYNIIFQLPNKYSIIEFISRRMGIWHHDKTYRSKEIIQLLEKSNFQIVDIELEHFIPAQVSRFNTQLGEILDKRYIKIYNLDRFLCKTPLSQFAEDFRVLSIKI